MSTFNRTTNRARHVGYKSVPNGIVPLVRRMQGAGCASSLPTFMGGRHVGYGLNSGAPLTSFTWECCDALCTDAEIAGNTCYVKADCWPVGEGPGITRRVILYVSEVENCFSGRNRKVVLLYDDIDGVWKGDDLLRGGTIHWQLFCNPSALVDGATKFNLSWTGCDSGSIDAPYECIDPLVINFGQAVFPGCCSCAVSGFPTTDRSPTLHMVAVANCRRTVWARHVGYTADGIPIVARERPCYGVQSDVTEKCSDMTCPINAEITAAGSCSCMDGTYPLEYSVGQWQNIGAFIASCSAGEGQITVNCTDLDDGLVRLDITLRCGITGSGTGSITIPASQLEDLDVTTTVSFSDPGAPPECCSSDTITVRLIRP